MAFSSLKLVSYSPVFSDSTGENRLQGRRQNIVKASVKRDNGISRREAVSLMTGTLLLTSFVPVDFASARVSKPGIRGKIMEKLEKLREKAGMKKNDKKEPKLEKNDPKVEKKEEKKEAKVEKKEEKKEPKIEKEEKKETKVEKKEEKKDVKVGKKEVSPSVEPLKVPPVESSVF